MRYTKQKIFNLTLKNLKITMVANEGDKNWEVLEEYYQPAFQQVIEATEWVFADQFRKLLKLKEAPLDMNYLFAYDLPNDCASPREIVKLKTEKIENFKIATVNKKMQLWCNRDNAVLRYTRNDVTEDEITSNFAIALSWYLAFLSAPSIAGSRATQSDCLQVYTQLIDSAQVVNANFDNNDEEQYNNWLEARNG
ncbi:MAG: hypothetical protein DKM24_01065 [Candidatus Melainabacteria bacterium]|nr:MAG: hypothetical protein DKM24_01065 [Candidatus Melainabacteria bacterium]